MKVDARSILYMALEATAHAAPKATVPGRVQAISTCLQWGKVAHHRTLWILLTQDMIIERTLVIIGYLARWIPGEEVVGKFSRD